MSRRLLCPLRGKPVHMSGVRMEAGNVLQDAVKEVESTPHRLSGSARTTDSPPISSHPILCLQPASTPRRPWVWPSVSPAEDQIRAQQHGRHSCLLAWPRLSGSGAPPLAAHNLPPTAAPAPGPHPLAGDIHVVRNAGKARVKEGARQLAMACRCNASTPCPVSQRHQG